MIKSKIKYFVFFMIILSKINFSQNVFREISIKNEDILINFDNISKKYINKKMDEKSIESLINDITQKLIDDGYITSRVKFNSGNINDGSINLEILGGRISNIEFNEKGNERKLKFAFGEYKGKILNVNDLNRGIENLNILSNNHLMKIKADKNSYSKIIINADNKKNKELSVGININNEILKERKINFNIDYEKANTFSLNDIFKANLASAFNILNTKKNENTLNLSFEFPYDRYKFSYALTLSNNNDLINGNNANYSFRKFNVKNTIFLNKNVFNVSKDKIDIYGKAEIENNLTYINKEKINVQSYDKYKLNMGMKYSKKIENSSFLLNIDYEINKLSNYDKLNQKLRFDFRYSKNKYIGSNILKYDLDAGIMTSNNDIYLGSESKIRGNFIYDSYSNNEIFAKNTLTYMINKNNFNISPYVGLDLTSNFKKIGSSFTLGIKFNNDRLNTNFNYSRSLIKNTNSNKFNFNLGYMIF